MLTYNETTGEIGAYPITDVISHVDPEIVLLTIDDETLETTAEHPFYELESVPWLAAGQTAGRWTDALDLQAGDRVWKADGSSGVVQAVEVAPVPQRMYNLTVDKAHTFYVGQGQWLVHNCLRGKASSAAFPGIQSHTKHFGKVGARDATHYVELAQANIKAENSIEFTFTNSEGIDRLGYFNLGTRNITIVSKDGSTIVSYHHLDDPSRLSSGAREYRNSTYAAQYQQYVQSLLNKK